MTGFYHRPFRAVLIPWVMTLVALFGLNALLPDYSNLRKNESPDGIGLSQQADDAQMAGRISKEHDLLTPHLSDEVGPVDLAWLRLLMEIRRERPWVQPLEGATRGRAPPVDSLV